MKAVSPQSGFSLIELMMAIFIMALATSLIVMTLPPQPGRLDREVIRLQSEIERIADQAMVSGHNMGLDITREGYVIMRRREGAWQVVTGTRHTLPDDITLAYQREASGELPESWPEVRIDPIGRMDASEITLVGRTGRVVLSLAETMQVSVVADAK